ncbi:MAG TPA: hypothetical protein VK196_19680 [Magnetospirillum sp.]|nr:hypothetical protein [Magnetospirillum sp.]
MPDMDTGMERHHTDRGLTGDKVAVLDPAAAPVHADAEAAGTPTSHWAVAATLAQIRDYLASELRPDTFGAYAKPGSLHQARLLRKLVVWQIALPVLLGLLAGWYGWPVR